MSPLPPSPPSSDSNTNWRDLYRAALLELDQTKFAQRVAEAEAVVSARVNQLFQDGDGNGEESEALNDAMYALRALRSASKFNTSHQVGNDGEMNVA
jgi:hypothetical protein